LWLFETALYPVKYTKLQRATFIVVGLDNILSTVAVKVHKKERSGPRCNGTTSIDDDCIVVSIANRFEYAEKKFVARSYGWDDDISSRVAKKTARKRIKDVVCEFDIT
jgi:hypothetical protein